MPKRRFQPKFFARVKAGKLDMPSQTRQMLDERIRGMEGKQVQLTIDSVARKRSLPQNDYYWGVVIKMLSDEGPGQDDEWWHCYLKLMFLPSVFGIEPMFDVHDMDDNAIRIAGRLLTTTTLKTKDFSEYCDRIQKWAASEIDLIIPSPNEIDLKN